MEAGGSFPDGYSIPSVHHIPVCKLVDPVFAPEGPLLLARHFKTWCESTVRLIDGSRGRF
jgi:hypothetical protein